MPKILLNLSDFNNQWNQSVLEISRQQRERRWQILDEERSKTQNLFRGCLAQIKEYFTRG